jgi:hypothetical protein
MQIIKEAGKISKLEDKIQNMEIPDAGHRAYLLATHGVPNEQCPSAYGF